MKPKHFKRIRERLGLSQTSLAATLNHMTGVGSRQLVAKIEAGKTPIMEHIEDAINELDYAQITGTENNPIKFDPLIGFHKYQAGCIKDGHNYSYRLTYSEYLNHSAVKTALENNKDKDKGK